MGGWGILQALVTIGYGSLGGLRGMVRVVLQFADADAFCLDFSRDR